MLARVSGVAGHRPQVSLGADDVSVRDALQLGLARGRDGRRLRPARSIQIESWASLPEQAPTRTGKWCVALEEDVGLAEAAAPWRDLGIPQ